MITFDEALARWPVLAPLSDGWEWELRHRGRTKLWGRHFTCTVQMGVFVYGNGDGSVVRLDNGFFSARTEGPLDQIVEYTLELMARDRWW